MYGARKENLKETFVQLCICIFRFFICELLNLFNVSLQVYLIDSMLGGEFSRFGINVSYISSRSFFVFSHQVISHAMLDDEERMDPMAKVFPKITKCTFHNFGSSGTIQQ